LWQIFDLDFWNRKREREATRMVRPPARLVSVESEYRPWDRGKGQEIRSEVYWQIPFVQQKALYQRNAWVKKCIDHMSANAAGLKWQISVEEDHLESLETDPRLKIALEMAKQFFKRPNTLKTTFSEIIKMTIRDLKIMDAAVWEKIRDTKGRLVGIKPFDAATVRIDIDEHGKILHYFQELKGSNLYGLYAGSRHPYLREDERNEDGLIQFKPDDIIYIMLNPRSESPYGSSPISALIEAIYADLATDTNLGTFLLTGGINLGFLTIGQELNPETVERIRYKFRESLAPGERYNFPIISATEDIKWNNMQMSNQEAQMAELQAELRNKILAVLSVPPNELGLVGNTRGQVYSQQDVFWGNAIIPTMLTIAEKITNEILREFDERLVFEFLPPKEYQYESLIARIVTLEKEGLIDRRTKYKWLGLPIPEALTYVEEKKEMELEQMRMGIEAQRLELEVQKRNFDVILQQPRVQYDQSVAQTVLLQEQAGQSQASQALQEKQMALEDKQLELQKQQLQQQGDLANKDFKIQQIQLAMQLRQLSQEYEMMKNQGAAPPPVQNNEIINGLISGKLDISQLSDMIQNGQVDSEQLQQISAASKVAKTLSLAKSIKAINGTVPQSATDGIEFQNSFDQQEKIESKDLMNTSTPSEALSSGIPDTIKLGKTDGGKGFVSNKIRSILGMLNKHDVGIENPQQTEQRSVEGIRPV
jgi:phage portal protein BeeE